SLNTLGSSATVAPALSTSPVRGSTLMSSKEKALDASVVIIPSGNRQKRQAFRQDVRWCAAYNQAARSVAHCGARRTPDATICPRRAFDASARLIAAIAPGQ